jgi:ATP-dependent DNA helicase RecG
MRGGQDLVTMTPDRLRAIFAEAGPDFSAEICSRVSISALEPTAIEQFREQWQLKSRNPALDNLSFE